MSQRPKGRTLVLTISTAMIAVVGAWYGAGLKQKQDIKEEVKTRREATPAEKIAYLEQAKTGLIAKKAGLEAKLAQLEARKQNRRDRKETQAVDGR